MVARSRCVVRRIPGALLGGLVSVFVAFWIVRATKSADIDVAREQAALAAAEQIQEQVLILIDAALRKTSTAEVRELEKVISNWEQVAHDESARTRKDAARRPDEPSLFTVRDWFSD